MAKTFLVQDMETKESYLWSLPQILEEINKDLVESQKGKWYESPYFVGILTFLLGTQLDFK